MKNWNTDVTKIASKKQKDMWKLTQLINYGLGKMKLNKSEIIANWRDVKDELYPERARMIEYLVWGKIYSLQNKKKSWNLPVKTSI